MYGATERIQSTNCACCESDSVAPDVAGALAGVGTRSVWEFMPGIIMRPHVECTQKSRFGERENGAGRRIRPIARVARRGRGARAACWRREAATADDAKVAAGRAAVTRAASRARR